MVCLSDREEVSLTPPVLRRKVESEHAKKPADKRDEIAKSGTPNPNRGTPYLFPSGRFATFAIWLSPYLVRMKPSMETAFQVIEQGKIPPTPGLRRRPPRNQISH